MHKWTISFKRVVCLLLLVPIAIWLFSIAKCEYLTAKHGHEFEIQISQYTMVSSYDYLKVLEYDDNHAKVYYVERFAGGDVLYFERDASAWHFSKWETVWSSTGSASEFIWPYIR